MSTTKNNHKTINENIDIYIGNIKDGFGLTVEVCNNGDTDIENIQLNVGVEKENFIYISKTTYEIPLLSAGHSTEIHIFLFGIGIGIFQEYPLITLSVDSSEIQAHWKIVTTRIFGVKIDILNEISFSGESYEGYTLFGPEYSRYTYLINNKGETVHTWKSDYIQGFGNYLLENGQLLRLDLPFDNPVFVGGGVAGRVEKFDGESNLLWEFEYSTSEYCTHHDIEPLPNGNILLIAWEYKTRNEAIQAGTNPDKMRSNSVWPDHIVEVEPVGSDEANIVWEWHLWDHIIQDYDSSKDNYGVVEDHPELVDINYGRIQSDWTHTNAVDYNEELDQILLSVHNLNEIWIIDHSTTTEEAASHTGGNSGKGGDLLYRWGNPQVYRAGDANDQQFIGQHGANWIEEGCPGEGNILVFNNGDRRQGSSSVDEIVPPLNEDGAYDIDEGKAYGPDEPVWTYTKDDMFSNLLSNAQRLPNGNTLICSAQQGLFLEVNSEKNVVWQYQNNLPTAFSNAVGRVYRYSLDYPGINELIG